MTSPRPRARSIYRVHYALPPPPALPTPLFSMQRDWEVQRYSGQVAGHQESKTRYLGLLKCNNGTVLKPVLKAAQRREIDFYETIAATDNPDLLQLRKYINRYHGIKKLTYNGYENDYLIMDDMAEGMTEPCIMDVKIGRRTWDPLASEDKVRAERGKYAACKRDVAFCVPGFQVYDARSGRLDKYDKDFGKKLDGASVRLALRTFLNAATQPLCRSLVLHLLSELWRVQRWAARQTAVKLFSSSVLLVYDARRLRECCGDCDPLRLDTKTNCSPPLVIQTRRKSVSSSPCEPLGGTFSGQLSPHGPVYRKISSAPITPMSLALTSFTPPPPANTCWHRELRHLHRSHSFTHNYDDNISKAKLDYKAQLERLSSESMIPKPWVAVKIIDFVHAFFEEGGDENFREGIDNLVAIFEEFLRETDDDRVKFSL